MPLFGLPSKSVTISPAKPGAGAFNVAPLCRVELQEQSNWCWAAVAYSIAKYMAHSSPPKFSSQKQLACSVLHDDTNDIADCLANPAANNKLRPTIPLGSTGLQVEASSMGDDYPITAQDLKRDLENKRPVAFTIDWKGGGGHAIAVVGGRETTSGEVLFSVADPKLVALEDYTFDILTRNYRSSDGKDTGVANLVYRIVG